MDKEFKFDVPDARLKREFGVTGIAFLALNGIVGAGIFIVPGQLTGTLGAYSPLAFLIFGLLFAPIVLCFAELAGRFRATGGPILYAGEAFGPTTAFYMGWIYYAARVATGAANSNVLFLYLAHIWPNPISGVTKAGLIALIYFAITAANVTGARRAITALNWVTLLKVSPLILICLYGSIIGLGNHAAPESLPAFDDIGVAALLVFYTFIGFENANIPTGETKNPTRTIRAGLLSVFALAILFYSIIQFSYQGVVGANPDTDAPLAQMAAALFGPAGTTIIIVLVIISVLGNLFGNALASARITFSMARQGSLPLWFAKVSERFHTPNRSIIFFGVLGFVLAATGSFVWLAIASLLSRLIVYLISIAALVKLRRDGAKEPSPMRSRVFRAVYTAAAAVVCLVLVSQTTASAWALLGALLTLGFGMRQLMRINQSQPHK